MSSCGYLNDGKCSFYVNETACKSSVCPMINLTAAKSIRGDKCIVCDQFVPYEEFERTPIMCEECRKAILMIRKFNLNKNSENKIINWFKKLISEEE